MLDPLNCFACEGAGCEACLPCTRPATMSRDYARNHATEIYDGMLGVSADLAALGAALGVKGASDEALTTISRTMVEGLIKRCTPLMKMATDARYTPVVEVRDV